MTNDLELVKQLEKEIGTELEQVPLERIGKKELSAFAKDDNGHVKGLAICKVKLTGIPAVLSKFQRLEKLYLYYNQISNISSLKELKGLTTLILEGNQISDISSLKELKGLTTLYLHNNQISDISTLKELKALTRLYISGNQIRDISSLKELKNLKELLLMDNKISQLPAEFLELGLEIKWKYDYKVGIFLEGNPLKEPPIEIIQQGNEAIRQYFNSLEDNSLKQLEKEIGKKLKQVPLEEIGTKALTAFATDDNGHVKGLSICSLKMNGVPVILSKFQRLEELDLFGNQISDISSLKALKGLTYLNLFNNQISDISSLKELKNLEKIILINNKITHMPAEFLDLGLEIKWELAGGNGIFLEGNPLETPPVEIIKQGTESVRQYFESMEGAKKKVDLSLQLDAEVEQARDCIAKLEYIKGRQHFMKTISLIDEAKLPEERIQQLKDEFGFIYNLNRSLEEDKKIWEEKREKVEWRRKIWQFLSSYTHYLTTEKTIDKDFTTFDEDDLKPGKKEERTVTSDISYTSEGKTPEQKGDELEDDMLILFKYFLRLCAEDGDITIQARKQNRGDQSGYDLKFLFERKGKQPLKILVECKNYKENITLNDIADKLDEVKAYQKDIHHWVLISPRAKLAQKMDRILQVWEKEDEYPFGVQFWTLEYGVDEFFGLLPEIYNRYFRPEPGQQHPSQWDDKTKKTVASTWRKKLEPPKRLPDIWRDYLRKKHRLILDCDPIDIGHYYKHGVPMRCKDEAGILLKGTLEDRVKDWLNRPLDESRSLILLGEFGDGKSVFTYVLARKLIDEYWLSPSSGWIPVRFALKNLGTNTNKETRDFLENRLKDFDITLGKWNDLKFGDFNILILLDGFDEMSKKLDAETVLKNIDYLIKCCDKEFTNTKVLITSRKHFFDDQHNKEKLITRIGNPQLLQLAPIDRKTTLNHLETFAENNQLEKKLNLIKNCHDPIGLASKPLFLEMVKSSLKNLPEKEFNAYILYETYIQLALERKSSDRDLESKDPKPQKIIDNLKMILEDVALALHESEEEYVYLSKLKGDIELKQRLWNLVFQDEEKTQNGAAQVAVRSLLKRVKPEQEPKEDQLYPVDFCHRSMREYFVARAIAHKIETKPEECKKFLGNNSLSYEIIYFAAEILKESSVDYESQLKKYILKTRDLKPGEKWKAKLLGCNAVNLLFQCLGELPGPDWSNLVLDGAQIPEADLSGKDFSGTSLRYANLDNVNFTNANFTNCDLTGVRMEETLPVQRLAVSAEETIYALYDDGNIREWEFQAKQRAHPETILEDLQTNGTLIFQEPGSDLTVVHERYMVFYDKGDDSFQKVATFRVKPNLLVVHANETRLLVLDEGEDGNVLQLVDLQKQRVINRMSVLPLSIFMYFTDDAFAVFDEDNGLRIVHRGTDIKQPLILSDARKVSCLAAVCVSQRDNLYRLAVGQKDGFVHYYTIDLAIWETAGHDSYKAHDKAVKDIVFLDSCRIASGGFDRKIQLLSIQKDAFLQWERELKMKMQCRGMKIDGVEREKVERLKLQEFINNDKSAY